LTCGWLLGEIIKRYAWAVEAKKSQQQILMQNDDYLKHSSQEKIKKKIIAAIKS